MAKAWLGELGAKLPQIALAMLAAKQGGPEASAAFMGGLQQSAARREALTRQAQLDEERRGLQAQQLAMEQRREDRLGAQDQREVAAGDFQRRMAAVNFLTNRGQELTAAAPNAETGERQFSAEAARLGEISGIAPDLLHSMTPNMAPAISTRKAEAARQWAAGKTDLIERTRRSYEARGQAFDDSSVSYRWEDVPEPVQALAIAQGHPNGPDGKPEPLKLSEIEQLGGLPSFRTTPKLMNEEAVTGTSEHAGRYRILRDEFIANSGIAPTAAERRALDDQARKDTVAPVDPEIASLRKDILRDQASRPGTDPEIAELRKDILRGQAAQASGRVGGRMITAGDAGDLSEFDTSLDDLSVLRSTLFADADLKGDVTSSKPTGTRARLGALLPNPITEFTGWGREAKGRQAVIDRVKQVIGKALEGGVLRKEDEYKYTKILPTIGDVPEVVKVKLDGLEQAITQRKTRRLEALADAGYNTDRFTSRGGDGSSSGTPAADPLGIR